LISLSLSFFHFQVKLIKKQTKTVVLMAVTSEPIWSIVDEKTLREMEEHKWFHIREPEWQIYRILVDRFLNFRNDPLWQQIVTYAQQEETREREIMLHIGPEEMEELMEKKYKDEINEKRNKEAQKSGADQQILTISPLSITENIKIDLQRLFYCVIRRYGSEKTLSSVFSNIKSIDSFNIPSILLLCSTDLEFISHSFATIHSRHSPSDDPTRGWKPRLNADDLLLSIDGMMATHLSQLDLSSSYFNPMLLDMIGESLQQLQVLNMSLLQMPIQSWSFLRHLSQLKRLIIRHIPRFRLNPLNLLESLSDVPSLEALDCCYSDLDLINTMHLFWPLSMCVGLKEFRYLQKIPKADPFHGRGNDDNDDDDDLEDENDGKTTSQRVRKTFQPIQAPQVIQSIDDTFINSICVKLSNLNLLHISIGPKVTINSMIDIVGLSKITDLAIDGIGQFSIPSAALIRQTIQFLAPIFSITQRLTRLRLSRCCLNDDILEPLLKARKTGGEGLLSLDVRHNHIGGEGLTFLLFFFPNLESLDFRSNDLGIERSNDHLILSLFSSLHHLNLSFNPIVASRSWLQGSNAVNHLSGLSKLTKLRSLSLGGYQSKDDSGVDDLAIYQLTLLTQLEHLDLRCNQFTDAAINKLQFFTRLQSLTLDSNLRITTPAIRFLSRLSNLSTLSLRNTHVSDSASPHLLRIPHLQFLNVCGSRLSLRSLSLLQFLAPHLDIHSFVPPSPSSSPS